MKIPLSWLSEYVDIDISVEELVAKLTAIGHMQDTYPERVGDDTVIDLEVRQNRPDCLSIVGIAREVAAVTGSKIKIHNSKYKVQNERVEDQLHITNTAPEMCRRFNAYGIRLSTKNSALRTPQWMTERLLACGVKSISPVVDITNYVTTELGAPLHAFDVRDVPDRHIVIRSAQSGEKLEILGGKTITLTADDLVIASKSHVLSLAGIIGGERSGVRSDTQEIVLEAASYYHASIRRSSLRHAIRTEASTRHEKLLHPHLAEIALQRTVELIGEICGGEVVAHADNYQDPPKDRVVELRLSEIERLGGVVIHLQEVNRYLTSLGIEILMTDDSRLTTKIPYWRTDIEQDADLVEEVLRIYGYENIPSILPNKAPPEDITSVWFIREERIRDVMLALGFDEQITDPMTKYQQPVENKQSVGTQIKLYNALNADKNALRTSLQQGLVQSLKHRQKLTRDPSRVFEIGKLYRYTHHETSIYEETRHLGVITSDGSKSAETLYLEVKGYLEELARALNVRFDQDIFTHSVIDQHTIFAQVNIERLWSDVHTESHHGLLLEDIPQYVRFDISFTVDRTIPVGDVIRSIRDQFSAIEELTLGESPRQHPQNKKSIFLKCVAAGEDVAKETLMLQIHEHLAKRYGAVIR